RDRGDIRIQQEFKGGFTPYYAGTLQNEDIDRRDLLSFEPRNINRHRIGFNIKQRTWNVGLEYDYNDDSIDPYQGVRVTGDAVLYEKAPHTIGARAAYSYLHFRGADDSFGAIDTSRDSSLADGGLTYQFILDDRWEINAAAA